ncbi:hypothetical protein SAMN05216559_2224 [Halomicrobium zhouii]|uniref:PGF-CTERM protein n=1 Tax=Halomicrobium zhouii TaxID=767519 RepID=A0A1I6L7T8_9EURY|nr:hypothetical protein [Halomicrobium zhouii]SFR99536.1 hypothetical protein SAMN05216559_2224 [Halomicrobium zhouii]
MSKRALVLTIVVLLAAVAPATVAADAQDGSAYAGSHVTFDATGDALVDYSVDGQTVMESVRVQSQSDAESSLGVGASVSASAVTDIVGAALSLDTSVKTAATVQSESGATLRAHDNGHGSLVVSADDEAQYVEVGLGGEASADQSSDDRLVVTTANGTEQAYVVAGEGNVTLNDEGNVTAALERDSRLVVRSYPNERSSDDEEQERMIANGTAAASVYLLQDGEEAVTDTVDYGQDTTVEVSERSANRVNMTVSRAESEGKVVIVSASEAAFDAADDVEVSVDGEAAAEASSYAELRRAANGESDGSRYMVTQSSSAEAAADVAIAVDHFSERDVTMSSGSDSTTDGANEDDGSTSAIGPGFGILAALSALAGVVGVRVWNEN